MPHRHPAGDVTGSAAHGVRAGVCRGLGEAEAAVEAASSPSASPTPRVPVGLPTNREPQTPRTAADEVVVVMEPAAAAAAAAPPATAPVPGPSAILSRQYAAVVAEVELLRARADVAEREAVELRELRDAQELRCDDLETQLLAREEQLLRATQQTPSPSPAALSLDQHITAAQELLVVLGQSHCGGGSDDDAAAVVSSTPLVSSPPVDDGERLAALLLQARSTAAAAAQQHAALVAELEVVRADRNELIGVQGNQVRALQEQLLDRDTAQCHLLEQLHRAQEQLAAAATVSGKTPAVDAATASSLPASRGAETALPGADAPSAPLKDTGAAAVEEVLALREQLEQMRTSAAVRLETQRQLLTERLALAASELKEARLRAEDDYDRLSGTIETLTRELADTKEALRIKEVSLRIALRESLVPPPLRITGEHAGTAAVTSVGNVLAVTSAAERQLHRVDPNTSAAGRSSSPSAPAHSDGIARTSASPSPPMPPHLASPSAAITTVATAASTATSRGGGWMSWLADPAKHGHARVKEDVGEDRGAASTEACVSHRSTTASHERSSRGLTVSTGGAAAAASESATSPPPPPREGSGSSSGGVAVAVQRASSLPSTATAAAPVSPPLAQPPPPRRSGSARLADLISEGELPLPLPLPLRSPLFSTAAAADSPAATSPESPRSPPMSRRAGVRGGRLGVVASCEGVGVGASLDASAKAGSSCGSLTPQEKLCELLSDVWAGAPSAVAAAVDSAERGRGGVLPKGEAGVDVLLLPPASGTTHARSRAASHSADAATTAPVDVTATTPARTPLSLLSASASSRSAGFTPAAAARLSPSSTPTSSYSPHAAAVAARHVQAALHRHRATWQQQEQILSSLRSSPSS
ncbi:hypothetical protein NESM_000640100 [Novymonas esmeraldas]|uniref:Uncharacterized protein n=1 Tax=Novymonas esmeraldas TaxID=1808958 RepID=A0AAW0EV69_9TRYP